MMFTGCLEGIEWRFNAMGVVLGKASSSLLRKGELLDFFNLRLHIRNIYSLKLFAAPLIDWESFTSCFHVLKGISRT